MYRRNKERKLKRKERREKWVKEGERVDEKLDVHIGMDKDNKFKVYTKESIANPRKEWKSMSMRSEVSIQRKKDEKREERLERRDDRKEK